MVGKSFWRETDKVDWAVLENTFHSWAEEVQLEVESPDMWEEIRQSSELLDASSGELANTLFTESELAQISKQLREVKTYVREVCSLTTEEAADVEKRFDDAEKASRRMGRKDWLLLFLGTLFPLIISGFLPPDVVKHILIMIAQGLGHLFGGGSAQIP